MGFSFSEEDHERFSYIIIILHCIRADERFYNLLKNGPGLSKTQGVLLKMARSQTRESVRSLTNSFPCRADP